MKTAPRAALGALLLLAAACSGDDDAGTGTTATTAAASSDTSDPGPTSTFATATTVAGGSASASSAATTSTELIEVADGKVAGGIRRISAAKGSTITFAVRADVTDHIHVHGYEQMIDIAPGTPATVTVMADIAGVFEVELEEAGLVVAELEVK